MVLIQTKRYTWWWRSGAECDCTVADVCDVDGVAWRVYCRITCDLQDVVKARGRVSVVGRLVAWAAVVEIRNPTCKIRIWQDSCFRAGQRAAFNQLLLSSFNHG